MRGSFAYPFFFFATLVTMAALVTCSVSAQESAASLRRGQALLTRNCARCHATGTSGLSPHPAAPPFRTLSRKYPIDGLQEALAEGLSVGHPDMPEIAFEAEDVGAILAYLRSIQER